MKIRRDSILIDPVDAASPIGFNSLGSESKMKKPVCRVCYEMIVIEEASEIRMPGLHALARNPLVSLISLQIAELAEEGDEEAGRIEHLMDKNTASEKTRDELGKRNKEGSSEGAEDIGFLVSSLLRKLSEIERNSIRHQSAGA